VFFADFGRKNGHRPKRYLMTLPQLFMADFLNFGGFFTRFFGGFFCGFFMTGFLDKIQKVNMSI